MNALNVKLMSSKLNCQMHQNKKYVYGMLMWNDEERVFQFSF